jgi:hypothetical protein
MSPRKRIAAMTATTCFVALVAAVAITSTWPFGTASSNARESRHIVWEGRVALQESSFYALDTLPVVARAQCTECLRVETGTHSLPSLSARNGLLGWPGSGAPSYIDCIHLRNTTTLDSVALGAPHTTEGAIAVHGWICATGGGNDGLMRLQYDGRHAGRFLFSITSWGRPTEG